MNFFAWNITSVIRSIYIYINICLISTAKKINLTFVANYKSCSFYWLNKSWNIRSKKIKCLRWDNEDISIYLEWWYTGLISQMFMIWIQQKFYFVFSPKLIEYLSGRLFNYIINILDSCSLISLGMKSKCTQIFEKNIIIGQKIYGVPFWNDLQKYRVFI